MKHTFVTLLILLLGIGAQAQTRVVKGLVKDENGQPLPGVSIQITNTNKGYTTNTQGVYSGAFPQLATSLTISYIGYDLQVVRLPAGKRDTTVNFSMTPSQQQLKDIVVGYAMQEKAAVASGYVQAQRQELRRSKREAPAPRPMNTEDYSAINENIFHQVKNRPLSTFSADVDRASYSNVRRFLNQGLMPPKDAIRTEEMINYFDYQYAQPTDDAPVAIHTDMAVCPWNSANRLVRIGIQGKKVDVKDLPASNIVFLLDVSGSMSDENKLPLVKQAFRALVAQLRAQDKVAIVVYAGAAGLVLPATSGEHKTRILDALDKLSAGGSTAGGQGIELAYKVAVENFVKGGNNRVILATDGDFNVGSSSDADMQRLIESKKESGVFLSVLGFGMGNYKDNKLETLADKGDGNYAYIDNFEEARRIFVTEFGGTLFTIAKDVKLQVEFNPKLVAAYRLIGYENRALNDEDFNNDKKDAGDMGSGHTVTALYEVVPVGAPMAAGQVDPLKYQQYITGPGATSGEVLTVKVRYKKPDGHKSMLLSKVLNSSSQPIDNAPADFRMAAAVAEFGMLLRDSEFKANASYDQVIKMAAGAKGTDAEGYRAEFIQLAKKAALLHPDVAKAE